MNKKITEKRNTNSLNIDKMETQGILKLINQEDFNVIKAVNDEISSISAAVDIIAEKMGRGGRLFYIGAGTSGRLGVLDAVECMPTFSMKPGRVIGILAGGEDAMFVAQEDIEDSEELGAREIEKYNINEKDSIIGIAASGDTNFVIGALVEAEIRGASRIGLVCNYNTRIEKNAEIIIKVIVGPEVLTGSTRMKAGTAQKMVLNMISTTVMVKLGKVYSNLMVDLKANNSKLRERAKDVFMTITGESYTIACKYLKDTDYSIKEAIIMYKFHVNRKNAKKLLEEKNGFLRKVLEREDSLGKLH